MTEQTQNNDTCTCQHLILCINPKLKYAKKTINKIEKKLINCILATGLGNPEDHRYIALIKRAALIINSTNLTNTPITYNNNHSCEEINQAAVTIMRRTQQPQQNQPLVSTPTPTPIPTPTPTPIPKPTGANNDTKTTTETDTEDFSPKVMDKVTHHYYKKEKVYFRCTWKDYDITTTMEPRDIVEKEPAAVREYLKTKLRPKAITTITKRAPILLKLLRKNNTIEQKHT